MSPLIGGKAKQGGKKIGAKVRRHRDTKAQSFLGEAKHTLI